MRAIFVDRDGVLNAARVVDGRPYPPASAAEIEFLPGVRERLAALKDKAFAVICVTNQPDVARRTTSRSAVELINARVRQEMPLDDLLVCYHDEGDDCNCRKPRPGLLLDAARTHGIALENSYMIGDRWKDIACGAAVNCVTVFIDYGYADAFRGPAPTHTCTSAAAALDWILARERTAE